MKKLFFLITSIGLLCDCNMKHQVDEMEIGMDGMEVNGYISIVITDNAFNDRLNIDSPSYFGQEYVEGITHPILYEGEGGKVRVELDKTFSREPNPPYLWVSPYFPGRIWHDGDDNIYRRVVSPPSKSTLDYYYIMCDPIFGVIENGEQVEYNWICYPDGSEDEIKSTAYRVKGLITHDKIWINGELAYERGAWGVKDFYYNPKYYPWMKPVLDDKGNQIGEMPEGYRNVMVLVK